MKCIACGPIVNNRCRRNDMLTVNVFEMFPVIDIGKLDVVLKRFFNLKTVLIVMSLQHQNRTHEHNTHLFINVTECTRLLSGITINNRNTTSNSFYIGFKVLISQNDMIFDMFLYMANVMEYGIQHFWQAIEH